jgi:septin family protein
MSKMINRLIEEMVQDELLVVKKMKKAQLIELAELLMKDNLRELSDDTIVEIYEEKYSTHLARY